MKKISLLIITLFLLTACQRTQTIDPNIPKVEAKDDNAVTNAMPAILGSDVEEMIVVDEPEENKKEVEPELPKEIPTRVVNVSAKRWEFTPSVIHAKQGEKVLIKIDNTDTTHNFTIPGLNVVGSSDEFMLDTTNTGEFEFFCANFCGGGHGEMKGMIIIE